MGTQNKPCGLGKGSENEPFYSTDKTAGIQLQIDELSSRGGLLNLESGRYDIEKSITVDTPSLCISGGVWACNTDPNGVFETPYGTKIRLKGTDYPAFTMGKKCDPISGSIICDIGIQGDIKGMDTRKIVDFEKPEKSAGLLLDSVRTDQCAFTKMSFCGLANAITATGDAEIDACVFEGLNTDGCGNGFWFSPRFSYYARVRSCIFADNPYYGFYAGGKDKFIHNLEILDSHFVRNGGGFTDDIKLPPAAAYFDGISNCAVTHCIFDCPGTFWYYEDDAKNNDSRIISKRKAVALLIYGNKNRIRDNTFMNSSDDSIVIKGDGNILMGNVTDGDVRISGTRNVISTLIFTKPDTRLILEGNAKETTEIFGVDEKRIVKL